VKCPRCLAENRLSGSRCASCGAPLLIPEDPALRQLDEELALDRRRERDPQLDLPEFTDAELLEGPCALGASAEEAEPAATHLTCAPLERRLLAWAVDAGLVLSAVALPLLASARVEPSPDPLGVLLPAALALSLLLGFGYGALAGALEGATVGQRLLGLRVVGPDGGAPGLLRSAARAALAVTGAAALGVGLWPAILTNSGRGLHDLVTGTVVVLSP